MKFSWRIAMAVALLSASACGKKESKHGSSFKPEVSIKTPTFTSNSAQISYESTGSNAKFKCRVDENGVESSYEDCDASGWAITLKPGIKYKVYVKSIVNGIESEPSIKTLELPSNSQNPSTTGNLSNAQASIVNRDSIGKYDANRGLSIVSSDSVTLQFGLLGTQAGSDVVYECRTGTDTVYRRCGGNSYTFSNLLNGKSYSLSVRATSTDGSSSKEDRIDFTVEQPQVNITGSEALSNKTGIADLRFQYPNATTYKCALIPATDSADGAQISSQEIQKNCANGRLVLNLSDASQITPGSYALKVQALSSQNEILASSAVNFCARTCTNANSGNGQQGGGLGTVYSFGTPISLGLGFQFAIPQGMHVTEYSTTKTTGVLSLFRVTTDERSGHADPLYLGNYGCMNPQFDRFVTRRAPGGQLYDYCQSTMPREYYKNMNEFRLANNHIEIASDAMPDENGYTPMGYERLTVSVFDADYEFMNSRSRFQNLCGTAVVNYKFRMPMMNNFYLGTLPDAVDFWTCDVKLSNAIGGPVETWRVGAFFSVRGGAYNPYCQVGCSFPEAVEMVYMSIAGPQNATPYDFALQAQKAFLSTLSRSVPN